MVFLKYFTLETFTLSFLSLACITSQIDLVGATINVLPEDYIQEIVDFDSPAADWDANQLTDTYTLVNLAARGSKDIGMMNLAARSSRDIGMNLSARSSRDIGMNLAARSSRDIGLNLSARNSRDIGLNLAARNSRDIGLNLAARSSRDIGLQA